MENTTNPIVSQVEKAPLPGATKLFSSAFDFYKKNILIILGIFAVPFVFNLIRMFSLGKELFPGWMFLSGVVSLVLTILSTLAFLNVLIKEEKSVLGAYERSPQLILPLIWIGILVGLTTFGGMFLLIVPGIIISILLHFSSFVFFAEEKRGFSALAGSWHYARGYLGELFWRFLFLILILILLSIPFSLIAGFRYSTEAFQMGKAVQGTLLGGALNLMFSTLFVSPFGLIYGYLVYKSLKEIKLATPLEGLEEQKIKANIKVFLWIGIIGIFVVSALILFIFVNFYPQIGQMMLQGR